MDLNLSPTSRKRRHPSNFTNNGGDSNDDDDNDNEHDNSHNDTPSKRLQNPQGLPIARQTYHLNTNIILRSLALTRLRVTTNFSLYNPNTSPVLICVTRENDSLYRTLCTILSSLYPQSPHLQSLCIMPATQTSTTFWAPFQRAIPIFTPADLDEEAADEVHTFLDNVTSTPDLIVLFDPAGRSLWSSTDLPLQSQTEWDCATVLRRHLSRALQKPTRASGLEVNGGEAMDLALD